MFCCLRIFQIPLPVPHHASTTLALSQVRHGACRPPKLIQVIVCLHAPLVRTPLINHESDKNDRRAVRDIYVSSEPSTSSESTHWCHQHGERLGRTLYKTGKHVHLDSKSLVGDFINVFPCFSSGGNRLPHFAKQVQLISLVKDGDGRTAANCSRLAGYSVGYIQKHGCDLQEISRLANVHPARNKLPSRMVKCPSVQIVDERLWKHFCRHQVTLIYGPFPSKKGSSTPPGAQKFAAPIALLTTLAESFVDN